MAISKPAPPKKKESGCGCFGCGCGSLFIILVLLGCLGLAGGYMGYKKVLDITTSLPEAVPAFTPTNDGFSVVQNKISEFQSQGQGQGHQATTLHLTADDINNLIAHNEEMVKKNIHVFVTITGNEGQVQASLPTDLLVEGLFPGRYISFDTGFGLSFDSTTKSVNVAPRTLKAGALVLMGEKVDPSQESFNKAFMSSFVPAFNQSFNKGLRNDPTVAKFLDNAKNIEIKNSELIIEQ